MNTLVIALVTFVACFFLSPILRWVGRMFGLWTVVEEGSCKVFTLFGQVSAVMTEPGLHFPLAEMGPAALVVNWLGRTYTLDTRLDQEYLRSQAVNSEEGAPMGIGVWYEMSISDPVAYLFKNQDPRGSMRASVSSATVRCLSNMKLGDMLETRHQMSRSVRTEVSPQSEAWGYRLGSVYIRKVHFRDMQMIRQIEEKVVNRLRQVTASINQDGTNQVNVIRNTAERQAAAEFAKAAALRPQIVGAALQDIARVPEISNALFEILELQRMIDAGVEITLLPSGETDVLTANIIGRPPQPPPTPK